MSEPPQAVDTALNWLRAWPGYSTIARLLDDLPDLDLYLAGGALRDALLDRAGPRGDFDLLLGGEPVADALALVALEGTVTATPFGSPRWLPGASKIHYADLMAISRFDNGLWPCEDVVDVLNQFDFTANAVAADLRTGRFFDPQNGRRDIARRLMRAVRFDAPDEPILSGHPLERNTILWFRLLHYAARLGFAIEPVTLRWLVARRANRRYAGLFERTFFPLDERYLEPLRPYG